MTLEKQVLAVLAEIGVTRLEFTKLSADAARIVLERPEDKDAMKERLEALRSRLARLDTKLQDLQQRLNPVKTG